ncbi:MAG TPA: hypothetical protein VNG70_11000 [Candidatus Limnocylindria bacterium]|nr:hypothetical protein [Candidatus Limnocylindria bacterium]
MGRLLFAIGVSAVILMQPAVALAAPSPSPSLDRILLSPPGSGFVEQPKTASGIFEGPFDAEGYAAITSSADVAAAKKALQADGFLAGYGRTWVSAAKHLVYVEAIMAFNGASGAKAWLKQSELADKAEAAYQKPITITGIETYYGARLVDTANSIYADAYVFVKGNDTFLISTVSTKDDLATTAATQARLQFDSAPPYTVPPAQWPESTSSNKALDVAKLIGAFVGGVLIIGLVVAALLMVRSRRRPPLLAVAPQGGYAAVEAAPVGHVQMSEDRRSWWDGTTWRDAEHEAPPTAQRSDDGKYWWDGEAWRAVAGA